MILNTLLLINCILFINSKNALTSKIMKSKPTTTETNEKYTKVTDIINTDIFFESSLEENWDKVNPLKILKEKPTTMFPITRTLKRKPVPKKEYRLVPPVPKNNQNTKTTVILFETNPITLFPVTREFENSPLYFLGYPAQQNSPPVLEYSLPGYHLAPLPKEFVVASAENLKYIRDLDSLTSFKDTKVTRMKIVKRIEAKQTKRRNTMKEMEANEMLDEMVKQAIGAIDNKKLTTGKDDAL